MCTYIFLCKKKSLASLWCDTNLLCYNLPIMIFGLFVSILMVKFNHLMCQIRFNVEVNKICKSINCASRHEYYEYFCAITRSVIFLTLLVWSRSHTTGKNSIENTGKECIYSRCADRLYQVRSLFKLRLCLWCEHLLYPIFYSYFIIVFLVWFYCFTFIPSNLMLSWKSISIYRIIKNMY